MWSQNFLTRASGPTGRRSIARNISTRGTVARKPIKASSDLQTKCSSGGWPNSQPRRSDNGGSPGLEEDGEHEDHFTPRPIFLRFLREVVPSIKGSCSKGSRKPAPVTAAASGVTCFAQRATMLTSRGRIKLSPGIGFCRCRFFRYKPLRPDPRSANGGRHTIDHTAADAGCPSPHIRVQDRIGGS